MTKTRRKISTKLWKKLVDEVRSTCPNPDCTTPAGVSTIEIHHIDGDPANNAEHNLIALCPNCHATVEKQHLITETDLVTWKRSLANRVHPRLGPETAADLLKPIRRPVKFVAKGNSGPVQQAVKIVNNWGRKMPPPPAPAPDSIAAHAAERGYVQYLTKRYIKCRLKEQEYGDPRRFHPAQAQNAIAAALGYAPLQAPLSAFDQTWNKLHTLVRRTKGATKYMHGYAPRTWDEYRQAIAGGACLDD